ncbi:hypothetical protein CEXT_711721 [Caerostris extrusa]|uniref:Uncharacterized protein n=1 Tax=Caerostris extrusa TaxID=172846 RepID=A0AAV4WBC3_CAEEX|nr:hypothetical protein CEXT_711721 [Caerostris extrusa]
MDYRKSQSYSIQTCDFHAILCAILKKIMVHKLRSKHNDNFIAIKLNSLDADDGPNIDYEFAFLADDGSVLTSRIENNCSSNNIDFQISWHEILFSSKEKICIFPVILSL